MEYSIEKLVFILEVFLQLQLSVNFQKERYLGFQK